MGEANIRGCIRSRAEEAGCGCFLVRLFRGGEDEERFLIDDYFPVGTEDNGWAFAHSADSMGTGSRTEMWPMVIEKAYAKFCGSYRNIEGGKVHVALAELTGGVPQHIQITDTVRDDLDQFWQKVLHAHLNGYLLGAGTPENIAGDTTVNANGIAQGHAYAVLGVRKYKGERLIKLRNPHGSVGARWLGDWGESSSLWTPAAKTVLRPGNDHDGSFWMNVVDFTSEFKYLYICRRFDERWIMTEITVSTLCWTR